MTAADVDELATAVRDSPGGPGIVALWRAVYGLEAWWLLPTGDPADPRPMVGVVEDQTFLLVFTSERHATTFAGKNGGGPAGGAVIGDPAVGGVPVMSVTPADLTGLAPTLVGRGVAGLLFDQGVHGFVAPVAGLESMWSEFGRP